MKLKIEAFRERHKIGYRKWYEPIGKTFDHVEDYRGRIYITYWMLSTPFGCLRLCAMPQIA